MSDTPSDGLIEEPTDQMDYLSCKQPERLGDSLQQDTPNQDGEQEAYKTDGSETPSGKTNGKPNATNKKANPRRVTHLRSQSHNKVPTRLLTSASGTKPNLSRSKSTDGIIRVARPGMKRNNRSHTKLSSLQPLTKTTLNSSLNRAIGSLQPLTKTMLRELAKNVLRKTMLNSLSKGSSTNLAKSDLNQSIRSSKSNTLLKGMSKRSKSNTSLKAFQGPGLKSSARRGKAILKLNEEASGDYEDMSEDSEEEERGDGRDGEREVMSGDERVDPEGTESEKFEGGEDAHGIEMTVENRRSHEGARMVENERPETSQDPEKPAGNDLDSIDGSPSAWPGRVPISQFVEQPMSNHASYNAEDKPEPPDKNLYGGSFLLSQSTGMTRKMEPREEPSTPGSAQDDDDKTGLEKSGINFAVPASEALPRPPQGLYQPNQTIFSNLQRNDSKYLSNIKQQRQKERSFAGYLSQPASGNNIETRTQQRLWLQRENLLMDVSNLDQLNFSSLSLNKLMFAHNYSSTNMKELGNGHGEADGDSASPLAGPSVTTMLYMVQNGEQNSIQSRTEFERLNREYLNVRRHSNPVAKSLARTENHVSGPLAVAKKGERKQESSNANSFKEFAADPAAREEETHTLLNKLWQEAVFASLSSAMSMKMQEQPWPYEMEAGSNRQFRRTPRNLVPATRAVKLQSERQR